MNNQILYAIKSLEKKVVDLYSKVRKIDTTSVVPVVPGLQEVLTAGNTDSIGNLMLFINPLDTNQKSNASYFGYNVIGEELNNSLSSTSMLNTGIRFYNSDIGSDTLHFNANLSTDDKSNWDYTNNYFIPKKPEGDYTLATLDDIPSLTGYVPYTGATANLNLGDYGLLTGAMTIGIPSQQGYIGFKTGGGLSLSNQTCQAPYGTNGMIFSFDQTGGNYNQFVLNASSLTNNNIRIYTMPNANGTLALTSDIPTLPTLTSGTYTPTVASIVNTSGGSTNRLSTYTRIGNIVSVKADVLITFTAALTESIFSITLPVPFSTAEGTQYVGSAISSATPYDSGFVQITTTTASVFMKPTNSGTARIVITFTYIAT